MNRTVQIELAALVAVVLALLGISRVRINGGAPAPVVRTEAATGVDSRVGPGEAGTQVTDLDPVPGASPTSRTLGGTKGSSRNPSSEEEDPAGTGLCRARPNDESSCSGDSETADPPLHYTDQADDAYGQDGGPPNAALSQKEFDILRVDWAPAYSNEESPGRYSTSLTLAGSVRDDAAYISWASWGRDCRLYHILIPRTTAQANAFCDSRGFVSSVEGGPVTSTPTQSGGTLLSATFGNRAITLRNLSAWTCTGRVDEPINRCDGYLDSADSGLYYRI
jgi:hypothetical protein